MATYNLRLDTADNYKADLAAIVRAITNAGPPRTVNAGSTAIHRIDVTNGDKTVTMILKEADLYLAGFENGNDIWLFKDETIASISGKTLPYTGGYTGSGTLQTFDTGSGGGGTGSLAQDAGTIFEAVNTLASFTTGKGADTIKSALSLMICVVSEAMRFKNVFKEVYDALGYTKGFTLNDHERYVRNWSALSKGPVGTLNQTMVQVALT